MSMTFNGIISGGTFIRNGDNDASASISKGFEILHGRIAPDAFHDSGDRFDAPKCHPNTRLAVIDDVMRWVQDLNQMKDFLWLYGPAGAGKSAIAQTIAELCATLGLLVASFFFFRTSSSRNNERHLMASIAYQLALSIPETRPFIALAVYSDPSIFDKSMETQVETLIIVPLEKARSISAPAITEKWPRLILIDGLDECNGDSIQRSIIYALSTALLRHRVPLILFVASRPEPHIRSAFNAPDISHSSHHIVLDNSYNPDVDIKVFLSSRFKEIKETHPLATFIPQPWPSADIIDRLVRKSSGQFIYASTVMKYLDSPKHSPTRRLDATIGLISASGDAPYKQLDTLYTHIFSCVEDIAGALQIIGFLIFGQLAEPTPQFLERLFGLEKGDVYLCLSELHSIINLPPPTADNDPIRIFHASLSEFLVDKLRSRDYYLDDVLVHTFISQRCLARINLPIKQWESSAKYDVTTVYSCLHFAYHCSRASTNSTSLKDNLMQSDLQGWFVQFGFPSPSNNYYLDISLFFEWLEKADTSGRLVGHIQRFWDQFLLARLNQYTSKDNAVNLAVILTFPRDWAIQWLSISTMPPYPDLFETYLLPESDSTPEREAYRQLFVEFFEDRKRSERYHVNGNDYARATLQYIHHRLHGFDTRPHEIHPSVLNSFAILLSKAYPLYSLYSILRDRPVDTGAEDDNATTLESLAHLKSAIGAYVEKYENDHPFAKWRWKFSHSLSDLRTKAKMLLNRRSLGPLAVCFGFSAPLAVSTDDRDGRGLDESNVAFGSLSIAGRKGNSPHHSHSSHLVFQPNYYELELFGRTAHYQVDGSSTNYHRPDC